MKIKLVVEEVETNANYKQRSDSYMGGYDPRTEDERWPERVARRLEVELTEAEWQSVKKAVVEVM